MHLSYCLLALSLQLSRAPSGIALHLSSKRSRLALQSEAQSTGASLFTRCEAAMLIPEISRAMATATRNKMRLGFLIMVITFFYFLDGNLEEQ
jgi:hypothetical protein